VFLKNRASLGRVALAAAIATTMGLVACGKKEGGATQVVAKVDGTEITVHQLNFMLQQQRNLKPEQAEAAQKQLLERLIDQQLAVNQAEKDKLDRDPRVMLALEAARREVLTRAYIEGVAEKAGKPAEADVRKYFDTHPANFSDRKIFTIQKVDISAPREQAAELAQQLSLAKNADDLVAQVKAKGLKYQASTSQQPAEALGTIVEKIAALSDGQTLAMPQAFGLTALTIVSRQPAAVSFEQAKGQIEQNLAVQARQTAVADAGKSLRAAAKIEYQGKFAASGAAAGGAASGVATLPAPASAAASASAPAATASAAAPAASVSGESLQKGLGIK